MPLALGVTSAAKASPSKTLPKDKHELLAAAADESSETESKQHDGFGLVERLRARMGNEKFKKSKAVLLNCGLVCAVAAYTFVGATVFRLLETNARTDEINRQENDIRSCAAHLIRQWLIENEHVMDTRADAIQTDETNTTRDTPDSEFSVFDNVSQHIIDDCTKQFLPWDEWTFLNAIAFAFTVMTTVGYGKLSPQTYSGRIFCIFFAIIGIPLTMLILANMGKHLSHLACNTYLWFLKRRKKRLKERHADSEQGLNTLGGNTSLTVTAPDGSQLDEEDDDDDDEEPEPTGLVVLFVFLLYVMIGACMMPLIEQIDFITSIYTNVMSVTAVDFTFIVGGNTLFVPFKLMYACIGLAITTVAIEAGSNYLRKLHYFGRKINVNGVKIWVGGQKISVNHLVRAVGRQAGVDLDAIHHLDLNRVVESAVAEEEGYMLPEEEEALLNMKKDPNRVRFIDSDTDRDDQPPPPPPPPPGSLPQDDDVADSDYKSGNEDMKNDSGSDERRDSGTYFNCNPFNWNLAEIPEESGPTPEPVSPRDSHYESPISDTDESECELVGDEWSPDSPEVPLPRLVPSCWAPSPPKPTTPRLLHHDWAPSPPKPASPRLVGSTWRPSPPVPHTPRLPGCSTSWIPDSPDPPPERIIGSQWKPSPPPMDNPPKLIGWDWSPEPASPPPPPKVPTPPPPPPRTPSPVPPEPEPEPQTIVEVLPVEPDEDMPSDPEPPKTKLPIRAKKPPLPPPVKKAVASVSRPSPSPVKTRPPLPPPKPQPRGGSQDNDFDWTIPENYNFEQLYKTAVRKANKIEVGRRRTRADAAKRYELYQQEWAKVERLTRPAAHHQQPSNSAAAASDAAAAAAPKKSLPGRPGAAATKTALAKLAAKTSSKTGLPSVRGRLSLGGGGRAKQQHEQPASPMAASTSTEASMSRSSSQALSSSEQSLASNNDTTQRGVSKRRGSRRVQ